MVTLHVSPSDILVMCNPYGTYFCRVRPLREAQKTQNAVLAHFLTSLNKHGQGMKLL